MKSTIMVSAFKSNLDVWVLQLGNRKLTHLPPQISLFLGVQINNAQPFSAYLKKLKLEFNTCIKELADIEEDVEIFCKPIPLHRY